MDEISKIIYEKYAKLHLSEIESASLMARKDIKYVTDIPVATQMLTEMASEYYVMEIASKTIFKYNSKYFDTDDLKLFKMHRNGKLNRYKVRFRNYVDTNSTFFEIKYKNNHGRTLKSRIESENNIEPKIINNEKTYLELHTPLIAKDLKSIIDIEYDRITLINKAKTERVTIDLNLTFRISDQIKEFPEMVLIEIKQQNKCASIAKEYLKSIKIRPGGISKYCVGIMLFFKDVNHNRFKHKFTKLYKPFKLVS